MKLRDFEVAQDLMDKRMKLLTELRGLREQRTLAYQGAAGAKAPDEVAFYRNKMNELDSLIKNLVEMDV